MKRKLLYLSIATLFFVACKKDLDDIKKIKKDGVTLVDWNPTFVAPLVNSRSTLGQGFDNFTEQIKELENSGLKIKQRNDGVFVVCYDFELESQRMNDYYVLPRHDENISLVVSEEKLNDIKSLPVGSSIDGIWDSTFAFDMTPPYGALLELLETSGGSIDLDFSHNFNQDLGLEVTFRSVKDRSTNNMLTTTLSGSTDQESILIDNHRFNLTYVDPIDGQTKYNRIEINVRTVGTITHDNLTGDRFGMDLSIGDYYLKYVQGYLGEFSTELKVGVDTFDFFDNINLEGMYLKEPKLKMDFESTIGMPMILKIDTFAFGYQNGTIESLGVEVETNLIKALNWCDVANMLRIQNERLDISYFPTTREYTQQYGVNKKILDSLDKEIVIMHPGPINRGVEITSDVADSHHSIILDQVENGVAIRMAVLYLLAQKISSN